MLNEVLKDVRIIVTPHGEEMHCTSVSPEVTSYLESNADLSKAVDEVIAELKVVLHPGHIVVELRCDDDGEYLAIRFKTDKPYFEAVDMLVAWRSNPANRDLIKRLGTAQLLLV